MLGATLKASLGRPRRAASARIRLLPLHSYQGLIDVILWSLIGAQVTFRIQIADTLKLLQAEAERIYIEQYNNHVMSHILFLKQLKRRN